MWYIMKTNICSSYAERGNAVEVRISSQMSIMDKLKILGEAAKYDVSCSSSGSSRKNDRESAIRWRLACATALHLTAGACLF